MDSNLIRMETEFAGRTLTLETGRMAKQANGSVLVQYGGTVVLVTATASKTRREGIDFFPLMVDFIEKMYAAGKIPGGFFKREAKPSTTATLAARLIDRPLRPLFPDGFRNEVHIVVTVLSYDKKNSPEMLGMIGASVALSISDIPFHGPIAGVNVGFVGDEFIINPTEEQYENSRLDLAVAGKENAIMMVEAGAYEISEAQMLEALDKAHESIRELIAFEKEFIAKASKPKAEFELDIIDEKLIQDVHNEVSKKIEEALNIAEKLERNTALDTIKQELIAHFEESLPEEEFIEKKGQILQAFDDTVKKLMRRKITETDKRVDGRGLDDIRDITCEIDILPFTHGSALFTRGETQSLGVVTLGTSSDEKVIDELDEEYKKKFYLHYNFPPFSVGETGFMRGPGRRELGHGNLAERSLLPVIPTDEEKFPYTIRIVSEILESNGSSSMATVCSGTLSLMAAGVPISRPVAGVANGLILEGDKFVILTDIMGMEDHYGDMDFKVAGTDQGITALQMDIKVEGITRDIMAVALEKAINARFFILDKIKNTIPEPRSEISPIAPHIEVIRVKPDRIGEIIGPQGKIIKAIIEETGVAIDIEDDGTVRIASPDRDSIQKAREKIEAIVEEPEIGKIYEGVVKSVRDFGAFVEFLPRQEGLVHISNLENKRTENVADVIGFGDKVKVKVIGIDKDGKVQLSMKDIDDAIIERNNRPRRRDFSPNKKRY
ncbi:MAG: polyribonucleotide nucleotidyltransferase [Candidatus Cloacimonetes bacterium]|nr:polyribonucleotide nucleotidyltransferase [Candidatus Cloacimonadota bacterium]